MSILEINKQMWKFKEPAQYYIAGGYKQLTPETELTQAWVAWFFSAIEGLF